MVTDQSYENVWKEPKLCSRVQFFARSFLDRIGAVLSDRRSEEGARNAMDFGPPEFAMVGLLPIHID